MSRQDEIRNLLRQHHRRLQVLKEQQAKFGLHTPAHIIVDIEDTEAEIEVLQAELKDIQDDPHALAQRIEEQQKRIAAGLAEIREQTTGRAPAEQSHVSVVGRPPLGAVEHFKNRVREQEKIGQLLAEPTTRLVSVIGHGGMGKTALASKVLRDLEQHRWPHTDDASSKDEGIPLDGIVYLSTRTAGVSLERLFLDCAKMVGGEQEKQLNTIWTNPKLDTEDKISHLLEMLKGGQYVILLDNLEDLLDDGGRLEDDDVQLFFDQSLIAAHGVRLLVTSRVALAFRREVMRFDQQVKLLEGLPIEDGITLLRELDPNGDYGLRDAPEEQLAQAVSLVHGVPRALEVIAGILANDPFASLVEVMEQFYEQEDVVQALIEENYKRLDDHARRIVEALAVYRRPILPLAVDYLLEPLVPGVDVPRIIQRLDRTNIVSVDRATKTVILHPIDQDYAYSQLPEEETVEASYTRQTLERRAAEYYIQLRTPEESWTNIDDLEPQLVEFDHRIRAGDYDDAYQVLDQITAYLNLWSHYARLVELHEKLLGHLTDPYAQAVNLGNLGYAHYYLGQAEHAVELYKKTLSISREINHRVLEGDTLGNLGLAYGILGEFKQAIAFHEQALSINRELGDQQKEGIQLGRLGIIHRSQGRFEQAVKFFEQALDIARKQNDQRNESFWLSQLGRAYRNSGQVEHAVKFHREALDIARRLGDRRGEGVQIGSLGDAYYALGQIKEAIQFYEDALAIAHKINHRRREGIWCGKLANAYQSLGQFERALESYEQALAIAREVGQRWREEIWLGKLGKLYYSLRQFGRAIEFYKQALTIAREIDDIQEKGFQLLGLSKVFLVNGEVSEAHKCCSEALTLNVPQTNYQTALTLGIVLLHQREPTAGEAFANAVIHCQAILDKTADLYEPHYVLATALVGQAICDPHWEEEGERTELLAPAMNEYRRALEICDAPGVIGDALHDLELIQATGVEGLKPVFELLQAKLA